MNKTRQFTPAVWSALPRSASPANGAPNTGSGDEDVAVVTQSLPLKTAPPPMFQVSLLNDDYTPMEFVVAILQECFLKDSTSAMQLMLQVHNEGRAVCGIYPEDVAQSKVQQVLKLARAAGHPLQCIAEPLFG